ncbi:hypothetical protein CTER_4917 [Ruminiclostridium cellobioparum subsp. termitidis CT1112]|jgi:hypothetical protein|uniref:Uncharacterized protein n=1 Tax=Ruminiclostridium cellobioparum subsp. termitidis CT1112 TaxID=1195236 RepID=S0FF88_RUMCE|nr:hypothetical protein CTER_4917 [Ruminiclostridium cellobioparum subsp. termitidis CT1112]
MSKEKQYWSEIQVMRENFKFMREIGGWSIKNCRYYRGYVKMYWKTLKMGGILKLSIYSNYLIFYGIVPHKIFANKKSKGRT